MIILIAVFRLKTGVWCSLGSIPDIHPLFLTLSQLASVDSEDFSVWVQRVVVVNKSSACYLNDLRR